MFITTEHVGLPLWHEILVRLYSGYFSSAYRTGSSTRSEFTLIISTACNWNQVAYCSHSKAHNLAQESPIEKIKVPFWSAINVFSDGVLISVSTKCGNWVVYGETATYNTHTKHLGKNTQSQLPVILGVQMAEHLTQNKELYYWKISSQHV